MKERVTLQIPLKERGDRGEREGDFTDNFSGLSHCKRKTGREIKNPECLTKCPPVT